MKLVVLLSLLFLSCLAVVYSGTYNNLSTNPIAQPHTFVGGPGITVCKVSFAMSSPGKKSFSALMVVATANNPLNMNLNYYINLNPKLFTDGDLENANKGQIQTVQLKGLTPGTIYIKVIVFDTAASFTYTFTVTELAGPNPASMCLVPTKVQTLNQYCSDCNNLPNYGAYCNIIDLVLANASQASAPIPSGGYTAFTIPGTPNQITLQYSADITNIEVFIQFKSFTGQIAGLISYVMSQGSNAYFLLSNNAQTYQITINSGGIDVSIGVINQNNANANFNIQYTTQTTLNVLVIVLGVLGGLLFIALIVAAFFIIRRIRNPTQLIHPNSNAAIGRQSMVQQNMLTDQQIEVYFPSVSCRVAFTQLESSSLNLNKEPQQQIDRDCVICLCPIEENQIMKITYCRHLFHAHCLVEWFKKQRNCPYCRQEYSKTSTVEHYQHILKESNKNMLAGIDLAHEILRLKVAKSAVVIQDLKD